MSAIELYNENQWFAILFNESCFWSEDRFHLIVSNTESDHIQMHFGVLSIF